MSQGAHDLDAAGQALSDGLAPLLSGAAAGILVRGDDVRVRLFGEAEPGRPADASTPFHVCSCAKTVTAAVLSRLAHEGMLDWDLRVEAITPEFRLPDDEARRLCALADLAAMRSGLARDGVAEWGLRQSLSRSERLARAAAMTMATPFRGGFAYSNLGYIALALAAERLAGRPYGQLARELLFQPLGMDDAVSAGNGDAPPGAARPALPVAGRARIVRELTGANSEGSARVYLSARDAGLWMRALLDAFRGAQMGPLGHDQARAMARPATLLPGGDPRLSLGPGLGAGYGRGLMALDDPQGPWLRHGGGGRGWRHAMVLIPSADVGVMLMTASETPQVEGLAMELAGRLARRPARPWRAIFQAAADQAARSDRTATMGRLLARADAADRIEPGLYRNALTGPVRVERSQDELRFMPQDAPDFTATARPLDDGLFELAFDEPALSPQPHDPPFLIGPAGSALECAYFGRLERQA